MADTHVAEHLPRLPAGVAEALRGVDLVVHAGDLTARGVLDDLARIAPVAHVLGNHDERAGLGPPRPLVVHARGVRIGVVHGIRSAPAEVLSVVLTILRGRPVLLGLSRTLRRSVGDVDCVVFGHLHMPLGWRVRGVPVISFGAVFVPEADPYHRVVGLRRRLYRAYRRGLPPEARRPAVGILEFERGALVSARRIGVRGPLR